MILEREEVFENNHKYCIKEKHYTKECTKQQPSITNTNRNKIGKTF